MSTSVCMPSPPVKGISVLILAFKCSAREPQQDALDCTDSEYYANKLYKRTMPMDLTHTVYPTGVTVPSVYFSSVQFQQ